MIALMKRWRIINPSLLAEYAYILGIGGKIYIVTDVEDLFEWMSRYFPVMKVRLTYLECCRHLNSHPLFRKLTDEEQNQDPVVEKLWESTEEGQKVLMMHMMMWSISLINNVVGIEEYQHWCQSW